MEEIKREEDNTRTFDVYKTQEGLYINSYICTEFNIGNSNDNKIILNNMCYRVLEEELRILDNNNINLRYKTINDTKLVLSFTIYVDNTHGKELYISNKLCNKYGIGTIKQKYIRGTLNCLVTNEDIERIEKEANEDNITLNKKYVLIDNNELAYSNNIFTYYYDVDDKTMYIPREIYELTKNSEISIEGKPKIINDKNCYSITEEQLKDIEASIQKKGIEKIVYPGKEPISKSKLIKERIKEDKKGESSMNNEDINSINNELARIAAQEAQIMALLEENRMKMEAVQTKINNLERHPIDNKVVLTGNQDVDIEKIKQDITRIVSDNTQYENRVILTGNQDVDIEKIKQDITRLVSDSTKQYTDNELQDIKIDIEKLKQELKEYLDNEDKYVVKLLGDQNIDVEELKRKINAIVSDKAENQFLKELEKIKLDIDSMKVNLKNNLENELKANIVVLLGDPKSYDINEVRRRINECVKEESPKHFVKLLGDQNVDIEELKRKINSYIEDEEESSVGEILDNQNINMDKIKQELDEHLEQTIDKHIVKLLGDQNVDVEELKRKINDTVKNEKEQHLVLLLGNPDVNIKELEENINRIVNDTEDKTIVEHAIIDNIDLNAVREELLSKKRMEPTEKRIANSLDTELDAEDIQNEVANELYGEKDVNIVKLMGNHNVDVEELKQKINALTSNSFETVNIYKDNNGVLYAPIELVPAKGGTVILDSKVYVQTTYADVEKIQNKLVVIKMLETNNNKEPQTLDITICNAKDKLFIAQDALNALGMYVVDPHKIIVNKEIYVEITKDDLEVVRSKESSELHLNIVIKHITPVKG